MSKFWEGGQIIFSLKVSKNYFSQVYGHDFGKKCDYWCQFDQNKSFLVKMVKIGAFWHILGAKMTLYVKFWEIRPIIFSLKVSKNYFSQFYGQKCGQKCH